MGLNLTLLDVVLGLIVVYLVLSLVCTAVNELISSWRHRRGAHLEAGIRQLIGAGHMAEFCDHPLIRSLYSGTRFPSYIPSRTFAMVLLDVLAPARADRTRTYAEIAKSIDLLPQQHDSLKRTLRLLAEHAEEDVKKFHDQVEIWFNGAMERVAGFYKRHAQYSIVVIALVVSVATNADTLRIVHSLARDRDTREALARWGTDFVASHAADSALLVAELPPRTATRDSATAARNEIGTRDSTRLALEDARLMRDLRESTDRVDSMIAEGVPLGWAPKTLPKNPLAWLNKILGLLVTTFALSLGAPFWFDMLNKVVNVRSAGRSPEESPKPPEAKAKREEEVPPQ